MNRILYVINPAGHGGGGIKAWNKFKSIYRDRIPSNDVLFTERTGHAREITTSSEGYEIIAAVGGDGTVGEVMTGIMSHKRSDIKLAIIPAGTGNDIARNVDIKSVDDAVTALHEGTPRSFDIMRVESLINDHKVVNYSFLSGAVGFSCIPRIKPWMKRYLGAKGAYYLATFIQLLLYKTTYMTMNTETRDYSGRTWLFLVGNAESTAGGSMRLAPGASLEDGELNISIFPHGSRIRMGLKLMPKVPKGEHVNEPEITYFTGKSVRIDSDPPVVVELDGDLRGVTPAIFRVCPKAMTIITPNKYNHGKRN